jgi:hypothetical protein
MPEFPGTEHQMGSIPRRCIPLEISSRTASTLGCAVGAKIAAWREQPILRTGFNGQLEIPCGARARFQWQRLQPQRDKECVKIFFVTSEFWL